MKAIKTLPILALLALPPAVYGQTADSLRGRKIITNARMIGIGAADILDTYLSNEKYNGMEVRYISHTERRREHSNLSRMFVHQGSFAYADNRSGNGSEMSGTYQFAFGMHYNWDLLEGRLRLKAGGQVDAEIGFLYNTRNGNNPAQARLAAGVGPSAGVSYGFRLGHVPVTVGYEASAHLFGLIFSPQYGQSYYEIFSRGDYDHNAVPTHIANSPSTRQMLTVDFTLGHVSLRVGYLGDLRQAKVNNLKYHTYSNMLLIGFVKRFTITKIQP